MNAITLILGSPGWRQRARAAACRCAAQMLSCRHALRFWHGQRNSLRGGDVAKQFRLSACAPRNPAGAPSPGPPRLKKTPGQSTLSPKGERA
jgi:hypothetical protein